MRRVSAACLLIVFSAVMPEVLEAEEHWPRFRGPQGAGVSAQKGLPTSWTKDDYAWVTDLPGLGHSSPCVWSNHVFITTAVEQGRQRMVIDVDASNGRIRWSKGLAFDTNKKHRLNSFASATPATDGKRVYALFASHQEVVVVAYDFAGNLVWKKGLGPFVQKDGQVHGNGTSPIVFENKVILANQQDGESSIVALDSATGTVLWKNIRKLRLTAHSTPVVLRRKGLSPRLFINNTGDGIASIDPENGKSLFRADLMPARCVGSPVIAAGLVFATCGSGGKGRFLAGIPVDSKGDVTKKQAAWVQTTKLPYVPTPVAYGKHLFLWGDSGVVVCVEAKTGKELWAERVGGQFWGSPVCVDGKIYCIADDGTVVALAAAEEFKLIAKTPLGDQCHSTPAIAGGRMFIRGFKRLYCLSAKPQTN